MYTHNLDPILFNFGFLSIRWYSLAYIFGIILGSGCGGGLVVNKKIVKGANNLAGEWGHNHLPRVNVNELKRKTILQDSEIENYLSGLSLSRRFNERFNCYREDIRS